MKIEKRLEYAADPATVFAMVTDKDFQLRKCEASEALDPQVEVTDADTTHVVVTRAFATDDLPAMARSMIGPQISIRESYQWAQPAPDGSVAGTLRVTVGGAPVAMDATTSIQATPAGTAVTIVGTLTANMFMGGQVEKMAAPTIERAFDAEQQTGQEWLST